jgi:GT2 family glycosyltransferase
MASEPGPAQVVVSDDSDDDSAPAVAEICKRYGVEYVQGPHRGLAANRNNCLAYLRNEIGAIAYVDDDAMLRPGFFGAAEEALAASTDSTILSGREFKGGREVTPHNLSFWGHLEVEPRDAGDLHAIVINATVFPRSLFSAARFDERLWFGCEEADITAQAERLGFKVAYVPSLVTDHYPAPANRDENDQHYEVSRLYATYKRYRYIDRRRVKATAYAVLAPPHHIGSAVKRSGLRNLPAALRAVWLAARTVRDLQRFQRSSPPTRIERANQP